MSSENNNRDVESIIRFADASAKEAAFDYYWSKVQTSASGVVDLEAFRICVRLLALDETSPNANDSYRRLYQLILAYVLARSHNEEHLYLLAEICLDNPQLGRLIFDKITSHMAAALDGDTQDASYTVNDYQETSLTREEHLLSLHACHKFLRCSYWLPAERYHYITPVLLSLLLRSVGLDYGDDRVHDILSSLLTLLTQPSVVVLKTEALPDTWTEPEQALIKPVLTPGILGDSFFDRLRNLPLVYFSENAGKAFRTWFQWISYMSANKIESNIIYSPEYWSALRTGLLGGLADQRKYCLGIIQQSLSLCRRSFEASGMTFDVEEKGATVEQYQKYCALFEIIVLDRYPNQVQACLPELTGLLGPTSLISPTWTTALLAAALNSKVQEGVRKLIGSWYLNFLSSQPQSCITHTSFIVGGFLPWATQGHLFTSSLVSTRDSTTCSHGEALAEAFARLIVAAPGTAPSAETYSLHSHGQLVVSDKQAIIRGVLQYVSDTGGKIFSPAVLYLLEGLLKGISYGGTLLGVVEIDIIVGISRMPALPEIAADLCRAYCAELCGYRDPQILGEEFLPAQAFLDRTLGGLQSSTGSTANAQEKPDSNCGSLTTLSAFLGEINSSQHKIIQNQRFAPGCACITTLLESGATESFLPVELLEILSAFWEEADRQDYCRPVAIRLPSLFFNRNCVHTCLRQEDDSSGTIANLTGMLTKALTTLHRFAEGRTYLVSSLMTSLRNAAFLHPDILNVLPFEDLFVRFVEEPPVPKKEFLFEVVAAGKLQEHLPRLNSGKPVMDRDFEAYYGKREWIGYAAVIDLLNSIPESQLDVAKGVMNRLLEPWRTQKAPIPIISKSKNVLQLQIMLVLTESCVTERDADWYLDYFMHALVLEPWPRYRYLLEWIITRIYFRFPSKAHRILDDLAHLDENSPVHIASLIKLALLAAPFLDSEEFALKFMVQLIPFSASPKVHIRHEAHWCFPTLFDLAKQRKWASITDNPAFQALDKHVRSLDKFNAPPSTIRTLKLDAVEDFTLINIFQGRYLSIETPDMEYVAYEDFISLNESDAPFATQYQAAAPRVPLGVPLPAPALTPAIPSQKKEVPPPTSTPAPEATFFQTKSGFDIASLLPTAGPPLTQQTRPTSVILIASLIDNPTNIGGLSRISESFGLEALYIDDLRKTSHKDFKATSVTSEKHFPIRELKVPGIPAFLLDAKRQGYTVVGIEQTDRSGLLGAEGDEGKGVGTLPKRCVLVLGAEKTGITSEVLAVVDRCVEIKTVGVTRSLNVQTAGGIAMYEWWRKWGGVL